MPDEEVEEERLEGDEKNGLDESGQSKTREKTGSSFPLDAKLLRCVTVRDCCLLSGERRGKGPASKAVIQRVKFAAASLEY